MGEQFHQDNWVPSGDETCMFPVFNTSFQGDDVRAATPVRLVDQEAVGVFCCSHRVHPSRLLRAAWAVLLKSYTGSDCPLFLYVDDRSQPREGKLGAACCMDLTEDKDVVRWIKHFASWDEIFSNVDERQQMNTAVAWNCSAPACSQFLVSVEAHQQQAETAWTAALRYRTSVLSDEQATHVAGLLSHILSELVRHPALSSINLCPPQTIDQVARWNAKAPTVVNSCVHDIILEQCRKHPDSQAVCAWDGNLSYRDIDHLSLRLARHLAQRGLGPDKFVAVYFEKSKWVAVAMLAIMRAGGAFCLLDTAYPQFRLRKMTQKLEPVLVLSQRSLLKDAAALNFDVIPLDADQLDLWDAQSPSLDGSAPSPLPTAQPHNALFSIFTSGSTGTPKGVVVNHSSHASGQTQMAARVGVDANSRVFQLAAYAFDISVMEHLTTLMFGGCICIASESARRSNMALAISQMGANLTFATPTVVRLLRPSDIPSVKTIMIGGEPVLPIDVATWAGHVRLVGAYGPAECTEVATVYRFPEDPKQANLIGYAVGARCWVADPSDHQKLLPVGAIGELLIEGPIVARGYVNDAERTKQSFIASPCWRSSFPGDHSGRMYRTGDLVQYVSGGNLRYMGRIDFQAKLRGQRLELGEVEHAMREVLPADMRQVVADVVVPAGKNAAAILLGFVHVPGGDGEDKRPDSDADADTDTNFFAPPCRDFQSVAQAALSELARRLPRFMVPSAMVPIRTMPATKSAKLDRKAIRNRASKLTRPQLEAFTKAAARRRPPATRMELLLHQLIERVLGVHDFGMDDDYFGLGGDSVRAMALTRLAREEMGLDLPGDQVFKTPLLSDLAAAMKFSQQEAEMAPFALLAPGSSTDAIVQTACKVCGLASPADVEDIYPCTPLQEGIMALSNVSPTTKYVMRSVYRLPRAIDCDALQSAWAAVVESNPVLRTRIMQTSQEQTLQVVVRRPALWGRSTSLDECIRHDMERGMHLGDALLRLVLVEGGDRKYFVMTIHHSLYDGWSLPRVLEQVEMAYHGHAPRSRPFNAFVSHVVAQDKQALDDYWKTSLDDFEGPLWPAAPSGDHSYRPATTRTMTRPLTAVAQTAHLKQLAVTMTTLIRLSWALTLSQYSGSRDVVFGLTLAGRNVPVSGIDQVLGPTLTTVPLRVQLEGSATVGDTLHRLQEQSAQSLPFEHVGLQRIAALGAGPAAACRFQSLLIVQPRYDDEASTVFSHVVDEYSAELVDHYILTLEAKLQSDNGILLEAEFDADVIPDALMDRILVQFSHNMSQLVSATDKTLDELAAVSPADLRTLQTWNRQVPGTINCCVHDLIVRNCLGRPREPAVEAWDGSLTYEELNAEATRLAAHLQSLGVGMGMYVVVCVAKSRWTVVSMLAVMKAGAAFVLTDSSLPEMRLRHICDDTDATVALTSKELASVAAAIGLQTVQVDGDGSWRRGAAAHFREPAVSPESPAYAVFTSGSTGRPKGVIVGHRALASGATINAAAENIDKHSRCLQCSSFTFDASIGEIVYPLVHGGCVCIASEADCRNNLEGVIQEYRVNWASFTPSLARTIDPSQLTGVRTLVLGGEAMTQVDVEMWQGKVHLVNGYGPAECCIDTTVQANVSRLDPSNIGRGAAAVCWIVDPRDHTRLRPIGAVGELVVEGPIVAQGYLKDAEKTSSVFVEYPEWLAQLRHGRRGRLYKTGDLARYSAADDGSIQYLGRKDNQVKIRGQRIELFEVEHHLRECLPQAKQVIAEIVTPADAGAEPVLTAFVLLEDDASPPAHGGFLAAPDTAFWAHTQAAEALLRSCVPASMIPGLFLPLSHVPIASTGKADRRLLRQQTSELSRRELRAYTASKSAKQRPTNANESVLKQVVCSVLRLPPDEVGVDDNFFHLGGDSITAMKVVAKAREASLMLRVSDIFSHPRLADLAQHLRRENGNGPSASVAPFSLLDESSRTKTINDVAKECGVESGQVEDIYPCTPMQEALLALSMKKQGDYIANMIFDLPSDVDIGRLHSAWQAVCDANPILRTRFAPAPAGGNAALQVVLREQLRWSSELEPLHIGPGEPLKKISVSHDEGHCQLHLWLHHALYDGVSLPRVLEQAEAAYRGQGLQSQPFSPFAAYVASLDVATSKEFWRREFRNSNASTFPPRRPGNVNKAGQRESLSRSIAIRDTTECDFTLPTMLYLACAAVFGHCTASDDVVYGLTLSGRTAPVPGIEHVGGPTITAVPFRVRIPPSQTIREGLADIQDRLGRMTAHEQMGLQKIRSINAETAAACDFQCQLTIQRADPEPPNAIFREVASDDDVYARFTSCPLSLVCDVAPDKQSVQLIASFDLSFLDSTEAVAMCHQLEHVLDQIMGDQDTRLQDLDFASPHDLSRFASLSTSVPPRRDRVLHDLVFEQCRLRPTKEAICSWDGSFTYGELYDASTRLAKHLASMGIGAHPVTALCMDRSLWSIVAFLAILKAGSACTLMDPSYPVGRIEELLHQVGAKFALVSPRTHSVLASCSSSVNILTVSPSLLDMPPPLSLKAAREPCSTDPAFVIFTSGSTGKPKGIVLEHGSIATGLRDLCGPLRMDDSARMLHFASYAFDASYLEIFGSLTSGGSLFIPSDTERTVDLDGFIERHRINWVLMIPSTSYLVNPARVPSLRTVLLGGEGPKTADVDRWADNKDLALVNVYAPAECTWVCAASRMIPKRWQSGMIGLFVSGVGWITQPSDPAKLCAWGAIGELLVEGPILAREYIGDPEKTAASFISSPPWHARFRGHNQGRLYRTGDLVQYTSDGQIRYISRMDRQVKLNGQRMEPREIETNLKPLFPAGATIIVELVVPKSQGARPRLFAFVCLGEEGDDDATSTDDKPVFAPLDEGFLDMCNAAKEGLSRSLPRYMIPGAFVLLNYVPRISSGKVNRRKLCELATSLKAEELDRFSQESAERCPPSTEPERKLADLWAELLALPVANISTNDNFFHVGGDSVIAMRLVAGARQQGLKLTVARIFANPRLSDMASVAGAATQDTADAVADLQPFALVKEDALPSVLSAAEQQCSVAREQIEDIYPCTPLQEGLVSQSVRIPGAYEARFRYKLRSDVDVSLFRQAWNTVARVHSILRTRIVQESVLYQVVLRHKDLPWTVLQSDTLDDFMSTLSKKEIRLGEPLIRLIVSQTSCGTPTEFLLVIHHVLYDGWSLQLLLDQVQQAYQGQTISPQPFNRFMNHVMKADPQQVRDYWLSQLSGAHASTFPPLPETDYKPVADCAIRQSVPLHGLAGITKATMIQLAWTMVLSQYSDTGDVIFGIVLSGRNANMPGIESVMGPTITTVPVRFRLKANEPVANELHRLQEQMASMSAFEQFGLQKIRKLNAEAEAACQFQNLLLIQPPQASSEGSMLMPVDDESNDKDFTTYALELTCEVSDDTVLISFDFDQHVLAPRQAERILAQLGHALQQVQSRPDSALSGLEPLSTAGLEEIMKWNAVLPEPMERCVHDGIKQQCLKSPEAQAVCAHDGNFTYRELDTLSYSLARRLQALGVGPEVLVPILAEKSCWVAIAMLGVVRAGGAVVLLDPVMPFQRLQTICEDVGARIVVCSDACTSVAARLAPTTVAVGGGHCEPYQNGWHAEAAQQVGPHNALYVIFASGGSTGKPKGIVTTHASFYTSGAAQSRVLCLDEKARTLQFASHMLDVSIADYLWTFLVGGCVCVASQDSLRNDLAGAFNDLRATRADMTPSVARVLRPEDVPTIRALILGGESLGRQDVETWASRVTLVNGYGPPECSMSCIVATVADGSDPSTIGTTYSAVSWIVDKDDHNKLVPIGAVGELVLEGPILARGYLGDAKAAAAAFIEGSPPWLRKLRPSSRLYKTGDLVQYNADGTIRYLGRRDRQVKIRGQRVELGEIEHQTRQVSPAARHVVAEVVRPAHRKAAQVLAVFLCDDETAGGQAYQNGDGAPLFRASSQRHREEWQRMASALKTRLPVYMVPSVFVPLSYLPLSASGKIDRQLLRDKAAALSRKEAEAYQPRHVAQRGPATASEKALQAVVCETLNLEAQDVGLDDDFFRLGGDSIIAIRLVQRARASGFSFRVTDVFKTPVLAQLALRTGSGDERRETNGHGPGKVNGACGRPLQVPNEGDLVKALIKARAGAVQESDVEQVLPVTYSAERYLFQTPEYWVVNLQGPIDVDQLQVACTALSRRHIVLRSVFVVSKGGRFAQIVLKQVDTRIDRRTTTLGMPEFVEEYRRGDHIKVPTVVFPITTFMFAQNGEGHQALVIRLSHVQFDGYSLPVLWRDLKLLYEGARLPAPTSYAAHLALWAQAQTEEGFAFWREVLAGSEVSRINNSCFDKTRRYPSSEESEFVTSARAISLDESVSSTITTATVVKAAWSILLAQLTGRNDVVFAQTSNGRNITTEATQDVFGMCISVTLIRAKLDNAWTVLDMLQFIQGQHQQSLDYELLDLRDVVARSTSWAPGSTHQSIIVHQNIDPDLPFPFGEAEALITCSYEWPHPPDEILIESRPLGNGELQLTMDTRSNVLVQEHADFVVNKLCDLITLIASLSEDPLARMTSLFA